MDKPPYDIKHDRVARQFQEIDGKVDWSLPARSFEEALAYAHWRAGHVGRRQILRRVAGMPARWYSQSVR